MSDHSDDYGSQANGQVDGLVGSQEPIEAEGAESKPAKDFFVDTDQEILKELQSIKLYLSKIYEILWGRG